MEWQLREKVIHTAAGFLHRVQIEQVSLAEVDLLPDRGQILPLPGRQVVDAANLITLRQDSSCQRRSDKARCTGH